MAWTRAKQTGWEMGVASECDYSHGSTMPIASVTATAPITGDYDFQQQGLGGMGWEITPVTMARCGFTFKTNGTLESVNLLQWHVRDSGAANARVQWVLGSASQDWLQYVDGDGAVVISVIVDPYIVGIRNWAIDNHIGCVLKIGTGGFCSFYLNGEKTLEIVAPYLDGITSINGVTIGETNPGFAGMYETHFDDFYVDVSSSTEADEAPPCNRFVIMRPDGDGSLSEWTPLSTTNYQEVDDTVADDYEYNYVGTDGQVDLFTMSAFTLPVDHGIVAAIPIVRARKARAPAADQIRLKAYDGAITASGSVQNLGFGYEFFDERMLTAPDGSAWDETSINAVEFGYESY